MYYHHCKYQKALCRLNNLRQFILPQYKILWCSGARLKWLSTEQNDKLLLKLHLMHSFANNHRYYITHTREAFHVMFDNFRMRTLKFLDDVKTLVKLCEDIRHRTREQRMLRCLLKLYTDTFTHWLSSTQHSFFQKLYSKLTPVCIRSKQY